ncbi:MAG: helix-turn-helix transcriptional regulator [Ruminococcus sp.]|nr:helix-turn-helix transcriptional regulator [Ruminococcus sp.]
MKVIGKQIRKYRNEKGYTQEQLGKLLGVSTQAVSKWENGGTPDIELLPMLSDVLGVSIDALFGCADQDEAVKLARRLNHMPRDAAYRYAFQMCWAINIGLLEDISLIDKYLDFFSGPPSGDADLKDYYTKIMQDSGMATVRISDDFRHFFLMTEPHDGIRSYLGDAETLRSVFSVFADEKLLRIIFYMYSRMNTPVTTAVISSKTDIPEEELEDCMEILCRSNLATRIVITTLDGEINAYKYRQESSVIPLLCIADEITRTYYCDFIATFRRTKPLL